MSITEVGIDTEDYTGAEEATGQQINEHAAVISAIDFVISASTFAITPAGRARSIMQRETNFICTFLAADDYLYSN